MGEVGQAILKGDVALATWRALALPRCGGAAWPPGGSVTAAQLVGLHGALVLSGGAGSGGEATASVAAAWRDDVDVRMVAVAGSPRCHA